MSSQLEANLSRSLSIRLNLQISLTALPIVEEWMDIHLTRWMESVPLPPEMPMGHLAHFSVTAGSDLSRVTWRAHGSPHGFVPKMVDYLGKCGVSKQDMGLMDSMGGDLEPALVGSWVAVEDGAVRTGWQFCDDNPVAGLLSFFGDHQAKRDLSAWFEQAGIEHARRFAQSIGDEPLSVIEVPVPGVAIDDQLARVSEAFDRLLGAPVPEPVSEAMATAIAPGFTVAVTIRGGAVSQVAVISPGLGNDVIADMCTGAGIPFADKITSLQGALRADSADRVEYVQLSGDGDGSGDESTRRRVDVHLIPTDADAPAVPMN
ncbi:MAG: hypothetical protein AAGC55_14030 [Myxococcota bacterium]